jgi:hypothetical protein
MRLPGFPAGRRGRATVLVVVIVALAAAAGLLASPSNSAQNCVPNLPSCVALTGAGPSPSTFKMVAAWRMSFDNTDSVSHTVVFANGLCTLTLNPGEMGGPGVYVNGLGHPDCKKNFPFYVGRYAYTVDGKFAGTVVTTPLRRFVTLTARTHTIRRGAGLTLHGQVSTGGCDPEPGPSKYNPLPPATVLARHDGRHPFERIATVPVKYRLTQGVCGGQRKVEWVWKLKVQPAVTITYIAKVTGQSPRGQLWTKARSRPFTVRIRH